MQSNLKGNNMNNIRTLGTTYLKGFDLPINLDPKPNRVVYSKPEYINEILTSTVIKGD